MSQTTRLSLPLLASGQAQKHVTVNEALLRLDALAQLNVVSATVANQPGSPSDGDLYIVPAGKSGAAWGGMSNWALASYCDGAWLQITPRDGWRAWINDANALAVYVGGTWSVVAIAAPTAARNFLINGDFAIWQRGVTGVAGYVADRWLSINTTAVSRQTDVPDATGARFSLEFGASSPMGAIEQRIESANAAPLAGQMATLSFWARNLSGDAPLSFEVSRANASDTFAVTTPIAGGELSAAPASVWTRYSATFALPSETTNGLALRIVRGSSSTTRITLAQLQRGPAATAFAFRAAGEELALCERYYQKSFEVSTTPADGIGVGQVTALSRQTTDAASVLLTHRFQTRMRQAPAVVLYNPAAAHAKKIFDAASSQHRDAGAISSNSGGFAIAGLAAGETTTANAFHHTQFTAEAEL